jgi:uncharacterized membrane protein (UPF0182 family)
VKARRWLVLGLVIVALVLLVGRALASIYVSYRWYDALGAASLWRVQTTTILALRGLSGLVSGLFVFLNLYAVRRSVISLVLPRRVGNMEIGEEVPGRYLVASAAALAAVLGALLVLPRRSWMSLVLSRTGVPFGDVDPYFEADIGFFVYWLPFESALFHWALVTVLVVVAVVILLYALTPSMQWKRGSMYVSNYVRRHLAMLAATLLVLLAWSYRLASIKVLLAGSGPDATFTYADLHAGIPVRVVLSIIALAAAVSVAVFGWVGQTRVVLSTIAVVFVLAIAVPQVVPPVVRRTALASAADTLDRPYQQMQAEYARHAFAIDQMRTADSTLSFVSLRSAAPHVSAWDPVALARSITGRRNSAAAAHIGWSAEPNGLVATVVERPRTGVTSDGQIEPWAIERVWTSTADGQGSAVGQGSGGGASGGGQLLDGVIVTDSAGGYLLIADPLARIAAPALTSDLSRLAHAWALQNFRLLVDILPEPRPRIVTHRTVRDRVAAFAPFFEQGSAVVPVLANDTLYWTVDLYAASDYYPLSEHVTLGDEAFTYVWHAATAVVNAQSGRVALVADSAPGPLARSWMRTFPALFTTWADVPPAIAAGLAPATDEPRIQATVLAHFGLRGDIPRRGHTPLWNNGADTVLAMGNEPVYALAGTPSRTAWATPVLAENDGVTGLVLATGSAHRTTYWLPFAGSDEPTWSVVLDRLRHALDSTATLPRDTRGARGQVRAVPVGGDIAFVQPLYAWTVNGPPTLARIAIVMDDSVMTGRTMADATSPRGALVVSDSTGGNTLQDFRAQVASLYSAMRNAMQRGDWIAFGRAFDALGALMSKGPQ